ncbi:hypothetical protein AgCh_023528 [Apium graveolens]
MLKHIKKRPSKSNTMRNLLEDMVAEVKKAMDKMEVDIEDLESNQWSTTNYLIGLEGFFLTTESRQQQMEIYMDKTLRIFGFDEEVRKKPRAMKPRHDKLTRRRKPVYVESSVQSTCIQ